ncbi:MAG: RluA family pseudouridine synthase [Holosporales bacterium]|jgi:23S rRNA pseudouridine955/2504/2580 synthase|nr:RluA family pseudouridine synthase [Holosporales bacterium]
MNFDHSRLDKLIRRKYGKSIPQSVIEKAIRNKDVLVNGKRCSSFTQVSEIDNIYVHESIKKYSDKQKRVNITNNNFKNLIVYEDSNIIAVNKPFGLAVQLGSKLRTAIDVMAKAYNSNACLVHRIDRDTSGLVILAKNIQTSRYMLHLFKNKSIHKKYIAIVSAKNLKTEMGIIEVPLSRQKDRVIVDKIGGKVAITEYKIVKNLEDNLAMLEVFPKTGRTHQIRAHLQYIGCPILGDKKYGGRVHERMCLHAYSVSFLDINGQKIHIIADIPENF